MLNAADSGWGLVVLVWLCVLLVYLALGIAFLIWRYLCDDHLSSLDSHRQDNLRQESRSSGAAGAGTQVAEPDSVNPSEPQAQLDQQAFANWESEGGKVSQDTSEPQKKRKRMPNFGVPPDMDDPDYHMERMWTDIGGEG